MSRPFYVTGGTLKPDAPSYVERSADGELWQRLRDGEYCYVLTSRQMGKSSLMARTADRVRTAGERAAIVDLTQIGSERDWKSAERWYFGVVHAVHRGLGVEKPLKPWWEENAGLPPVQRFVEYFREVALTEGNERRVVFVDEIDSTIGLPFADDFFAAIRACFNERANDATFKRLSFVLLGVATPDQLISDPARTPFNVGQRVELTDFTREEARRLAAGLGDGTRGEELLGRILHWTGGQPYLTQVLCQRIAEGEDEDETVDRVVKESFLSERSLREETHLRHIRARLIDGGKDAARRRLALYRRIYLGKAVPDEPTSPIVASLKLSGVVRVREDGTLVVRNRLYERVFTTAWAQRQMPPDRARQVAYGSVAALIAVTFVFFAVFEPRPYVEQLEVALEDYNVAARAYNHLRSNPFAYWRADELMAQFWERRAWQAEIGGNRDHAALNWLQALRTAESERRRREVWQVLQTYEILRGQPRVPPMRHDAWIYAEAFSPDGTSVLTGSADGTARLWSTTSGEALVPPMRHDKVVRSVAFSPDGQSVLTGSNDGTARLWSATTGEALVLPMRHSAAVSAVAFSPDGQSLLTGSTDGTARLWSATSGELIGPPMRLERKYGVYAVAFSPDGKTLLTGGNDGTARLWSAMTGTALVLPMGYGDLVGAVAFSPDGKTALTGGMDGIVRLWSATSGTTLGPPMRYSDWVETVAFSPDGMTVLVSTSEWLHAYAVTTDGLQYLADCFLGVGWTGVHRFSDACPDCLDIAVHPTGGISLAIGTIHLFNPDAPPIEGDPDELLAEWQRRLGLEFDAKMNIVPRR